MTEQHAAVVLRPDWIVAIHCCSLVVVCLSIIESLLRHKTESYEIGRESTFMNHRKLTYGKGRNFAAWGLRLVACLTLLLQLSSLVRAQTSTAGIRPSAQTIRLYWFFFSYQHHLDDLAASYAVAGRDASGLRDSIQRRLGFSDADFAVVRAASESLAANLKSQRAEVRLHPDEASAFAQVRDQDVQHEIDNLTNELSSQRKAQLDAFVAKMFSPRSTTQKEAQ